ncbi:membrane protein [Gordonia phage Mollymur]|uniref:Membrane protein n=1 Tax=Gordonia phage Mollymur TaxID=2590895 RepID=A0A4Y6E9X7_9CAUD|nr:membrane protein [Gordonia phage Mollymur]QDF15473.1 membrane protein [Gordonia phage Mollymur]
MTSKQYRRTIFYGAILFTIIAIAAKVGGGEYSWWVAFFPMYIWAAYKIVLHTVFGFVVGIYVRLNMVDELAKVLAVSAEKRR